MACGPLAPALAQGQAGAGAEAPPTPLLVSDVDDTVKITHVTSPGRAAVRGLVRHAVYAGMAALYRELGGELVFLSASPTGLEGKLRRTLVDRAGFPRARFVLRDWARERDIGRFKRRRLETLAGAAAGPVLLVGDDTERDPELFLEIAGRLPPGRVAAIYIRRNVHRPLPAGVVPFHNAFELALHELGAGRLTPAAALRVGEATLAEAGDGGRRLYPPFYQCPGLSAPPGPPAAPPGPAAAPPGPAAPPPGAPLTAPSPAGGPAAPLAADAAALARLERRVAETTAQICASRRRVAR
jgi:hypothetical protein